MRKGLFVVLEGLDMSGKSTLAKGLYNKLNELGIKTKLTREPGNKIEEENNICEQIRKVIIENDMDVRTEALLFAASRIQHTYGSIIPALEEGYVVISDRYILSSLVLQGYARGLGDEYILDINNGFIKPDITLITNCSAEEVIKRAKANGKEDYNRLDNDFTKDDIAQMIISKGLERDIDNTFVINSDGPKENTLNTVFEILERYMMKEGII